MPYRVLLLRKNLIKDFTCTYYFEQICLNHFFYDSFLQIVTSVGKPE